jgi:hypothetical protein
MVADIVYVDDEPDQLLALAQRAKARKRFVEFEPPVPGEAKTVVAGANLWVFDFFNDEEQRQHPQLAAVENNGLSVFQQFRHLVGDARPPAMVVSNHLAAALGSDVNLDRRHIVAQEVGVEWIAPKVSNQVDALAEILALADSVAKVRSAANALNAADAADYVAELAWLTLALPRNTEWTFGAIRDVSAWRPPAWLGPKADQRSAALKEEVTIDPDLRSVRAIVAWLLRQALPYPSFLVSARHAAVRLGLDIDCFRAAEAGNTKLSRMLKRILYKGILADFEGARWWSAGIDAAAWDLPRDATQRSTALGALVAPTALIELAIVDPVVVSNADLVETDEIASAAECVRAADEYFPAHASPAWVKITDARVDKGLARKVKLEDQRELTVDP